MKAFAIIIVPAVIVAVAASCFAGKASHEASGSPENRVLAERNLIHAFMRDLTSSEARSRNHAELNYKDLSDSSSQLLVELLIDAFRVGDPDLQWRVLAHLAYIGPRASPAVPFLIEQTTSKNADIRQRATFAVEKIGPNARQAIPALIRLLDDGDEHVRASSASALRVFGSDARDAVPRLMHNLNDPHFDAQSCAAAALGGIGPEARDAVPALVKLVEGQKGNAARNALWALGRIGPDARQAVPILATLLDHEDKEIRFAAIDTLGLVRPSDAELIREISSRITARDMDLNRHLMDALGRIGSAAVPRLADLVTNENAEISFLAIRSLGDIGPDAKQAVSVLAVALEDRRPAGPRLASAFAPRTVSDWARIALDKIAQKAPLPNQSLKVTGEPTP
jgi:HEAT repeat protein